MVTRNTAATMLPNGRAATPPTIVIKEDSLPVDSRKLAYKAIDEAYDIQIRKGGIEDTQNILKGLQDKVGEKVFTIAREAVGVAGSKLDLARDMFLALCAGAEKHLSSKYVEQNKEEAPAIGQLIPQWSNYKSIIAKGLGQKIDPNARNEVGGAQLFPTAAEYRKAVQATGTQERDNKPDTGPKNGTVLELVSRGWSQSLAGAMQLLCTELNRLPHDEQDKFAPRIFELATEVHTFANDAEAATLAKSGNETPESPETVAELAEAMARDGKEASGPTQVGPISDAIKASRKGGKRRTA